MTDTAVHETLTAKDRCDMCNARALVRATLMNGELLFCGHHARKAGTPLMLAAIKVWDPEGVVSNGKTD